MLWWILLIIALMIVMATLLTKGTVAVMGRVAGEGIDRLHRSAEFIVHTHKVPTEWRDKMARRMEGLRASCADESLVEKHQAEARRAVLRRLAGLIRHFQRSSLVVDEEARDILVGELQAAREEWQEKPWRDIAGLA